MPTAQIRNASMQELGSVDHLTVINKNFGAEWIDGAGGQSFLLGQGPFTLNLDETIANPAPEIFDLDSDIVTITEAGLYLFSFQLTAIHNGGSSACVNRVWLDQDPDTGSFSLLSPLEIYFLMPAISNAVGTGVATGLVRVGIDYRYRVRYEQAFGSSGLLTVADKSKLMIIRLYQNG